LISIVVAARDMSQEERILENLKGCGDEVIIVEGKNPSFQRNEGVRQAKGDIIFFADDDTVTVAEAFNRAKTLLETETDISVLGGPAVTPESDSLLQKTFCSIFASPWATGKSSARYRRAGARRHADEKDLILCNLFVRKRAFEEAGGFREGLYPNEENEFINRLQKTGAKIVYDPDVYITRSQRRTPAAFIKQCFRYGRGRAEQILLSFDRKDIINTVPAFFDMYLIYIIFTGPAIEELVPLILYLLATVYFVFREGAALRDPRAYLMLFIGFPLLHVVYGAGLIAGIIKGMVIRDKKTDKNIRIKAIIKNQ
jgi:succinoglycan biosynthesis protein ExoA